MLQDKILRAIKYLVYFLVVAVPLVYFPTTMFPFQVAKTVVLQIMTETIFALWLVLAVYDKKFRPKFSILTISIISFFVIAFLSVIFGSDWRMSLWSDESRTLGLVTLMHFGALFLIFTSLKRVIDWSKLWLFSFSTATIVSIIGILQKFVVFPKGTSIWLYILYSGIPDRIGSTFNNTAFLAGYLLFNFFIGLWLIDSKIFTFSGKLIKDLRFWSYLIGTILIFLAILYTQTIGVILGVSVGFLALLLYFIYQKDFLKLRKISLAIFCLFVIFGGIFWLTRDNSIWQKIPGLARVSRASLESSSIRDRLIVWKVSLKAFEQKPILGWGFENFKIAYNKNYNPNILTTSMTGTYWDKPHNVLLEHLVNSGILGLLAYLSIFGSAIYLIFKTKPFNQYILAALVAYFVQNLFVFDTIGTYLMFFLMLAFVSNKHNDYGGKNELNGESDKLNKAHLLVVVFFALIILLVPIYYNYQIFNASRLEYDGVNYFLNQLPESSLVSFSKAVIKPTPYKDDIYKNFANTVMQAHQQGTDYPGLDKLQEKLVNYFKIVIKNHPQDFFNYISLAEFENVFYAYNSNYVKEAEDLANQALKLSPKRQQSYYVLAKTKLLQGDSKGAYEAFDKIIKVNPLAGDPHFFYGLTAYSLGDAKKGEKEILRAEKLGRGPQSYEESISLGDFMGDGSSNYKKAIDFYLLALSYVNGIPADKTLSQKKANVLLKLAIAYYFDNDFDESEKYFLELKEMIDLKTLPIYPQLKPVLEQLKINSGDKFQK